MEMRAKEDIEIATDITPQIPPLAYSLYNSNLSSHCSSCFVPLTTTTPISTRTTFLHFCNNGVCSSSSSLHYSSSEHHLFALLNSRPSLYPYPDISDLRLALRLIHLLPSHSPSHRFFGLLTNRHLHIQDHDCFSRVQLGAKAIAIARALGNGRKFEFEFDVELGFGFELEEAMLCLVITNAVEININGVRLGIGVYDKCFSWINHSCSPNSCFSFVPSFGDSESVDRCTSMQFFPCGDAIAGQMEDTSDYTISEMARVFGNYGPRIVVRSIKEIERGEEVTITYTDLLQPTALRQPELLLEYKFLCECKRCTVVPQAYVDHALQELFCVDLHKDCSKTLDKHDEEWAFEKLRDRLDSTIAEYIEDSNPVSCCQKVERLLAEGLLDQHLEQAKEACHLHVKLSPLNSLSLNAYTTLISAYKIRAGLRNDETQLQSIDMSRTSTAYSLLLAGATHHLFLSEPSLIASAATFWVDAGQSVLHFCRSPSWNPFAKAELRNLSAIIDVNCPKCSLMDKFKSATSSQTQDKAFSDISKEFHRCVSTITPKIWNFLIQGCKYLKTVKDPIDFSWIREMRTPDKTLSLHDDLSLFNGNENGDLVQCVFENELFGVKTDILQLGVHCLLYGGYLSSICYGHSFSSRLIHNVIQLKDLSLLGEDCCTFG